MVPEADFRVHVLAAIVELTVKGVKVVPSVLNSTVNIEFADVAKTPKLIEIFVKPDVLIPDIRKFLEVVVAVPKKTLPVPEEPV
jgi:hypothetical protein